MLREAVVYLLTNNTVYVVRFGAFRVVKETKQAADRDIQDKLTDCEHWSGEHRKAIGT